MDIEGCIAQLEQMLADARPVPLSASVMVSRAEIEAVLAELRASLPEELRQARWVIKERDEILAQAGRESEQTLADAKLEVERLVSEEEIAHRARREAAGIIEEAQEQARVLRLEAEDYVDGKLANFEIALNKTLATVAKGRERLRGRLASDELAGADEPLPGDEVAPTQFYDHETLGPESG
ncbi:MAG: ATPase [Egibacteraceae bacterium]